MEEEFSDWDLCNVDEGQDEYQPAISKFDQIIETPDDRNGPLTFGIELEFLVPVMEGHFWADPHPQDGRPLFRYHCESNVYADSDSQKLIRDVDDQIRDALEKACDIRFRHERDDILHEPHDNVPHYDAWRLVKDDTVEFKAGSFGGQKAYAWLGKEITSDVMRCDDLTFYTKRIRDICRAIRTTRVHLNDTCGVHIHVGHGDESFSLITMKKFSTLILLVDELLLNLHHPSRHNNSYCEALDRLSFVKLRSMKSFLEVERIRLCKAQSQQMNEFIPTCLSTVQTKRTMQGARDIEELAEIMGNHTYLPSERGSVGFRRFLPAGKTGGNTHTFEFRQMAGCLDPDPIIHWVKVCTTITDFARLSSPQQYKSLLEKIVDTRSPFSGFDLLLALDLVQEEQYFRQKVQAWGKDMELGFYEGEEEGRLFLSEMK
ncbi:putative amidoligase enzyme-domain-containing protein [Hypoxylon cercidicola]|nr:putative amidoligase enzyme-domain-containing protein [Hypoxylon cercidicola]